MSLVSSQQAHIPAMFLSDHMGNRKVQRRSPAREEGWMVVRVDAVRTGKCQHEDQKGNHCMAKQSRRANTDHREEGAKVEGQSGQGLLGTWTENRKDRGRPGRDWAAEPLGKDRDRRQAKAPQGHWTEEDGVPTPSGTSGHGQEEQTLPGSSLRL